MFKSKTRKQVDLTRKGLRKFINYKRDLLTPEQLDELNGMEKNLVEVGNSKDKAAIESLIKDIEAKTAKMTPVSERRSGFFAENVEVFFVVIAVMLGIRAYIVQPFKIPTNSMYPTLNGMRAEPVDGEFPNIVSRTFKRVWNGQNYIDVKAPFDGAITSIEERPFLRLFTVTDVTFQKAGSDETETISINTSRQAFVDGFKVIKPGERLPVSVKEGQVIAHGFSQAGDQVLVDKVSYHFHAPERGEVFVFTTNNIKGLEGDDPKVDRQHYIKRLVAVPGDKYEITGDHQLMINGSAPVEEEGIARVNAAEGEYNGYGFVSFWQQVRLARRPDGRLVQEAVSIPVAYSKNAGVPKKSYVAMGDNSQSSLDSRYWGYVPEVNLVGPALFVYFPLGNHFGPIE